MGLRPAIGGLLALAATGCGGGPSNHRDAAAPRDSGPDAGRDAAPDAGLDATVLLDAQLPEPDASVDASAPDAAPDAGPPEPVICELAEDFIVALEEGDVGEAAVAATDEGFVVVYGIRIDGTDVLRMALLDPCGSLLDESLAVDETGRFIIGARAAGLPDGGFVVGWTRIDGDSIDDGVVLQTFEADGQARSAITTANATEPSQQYLESAVAMPDGFALAWSDWSPRDFLDRPDVLLRVFDGDGVALTDEVRLSPSADEMQDLPRLGAAQDGALLAAYHENGLHGCLRRRSADGDWLDGEAIVLSEDRKEAACLAVHDGAYAVAIESRAVEEVGDVELGLVDADTGALEVVSISAAPGVAEADPRVAALPDGGWLVAWTDRSLVEDDSGRGVLAVRTLADGSPDGQRFVVPTHTSSDQMLESLAAGAGGVLVVWIDHSQDDDHHGAAVRARLLPHELVEVAQ